jgi:hypothetical protein
MGSGSGTYDLTPGVVEPIASGTVAVQPAVGERSV